MKKPKVGDLFIASIRTGDPYNLMKTTKIYICTTSEALGHITDEYNNNIVYCKNEDGAYTFVMLEEVSRILMSVDKLCKDCLVKSTCNRDRQAIICCNIKRKENNI